MTKILIFISVVFLLSPLKADEKKEVCDVEALFNAGYGLNWKAFEAGHKWNSSSQEGSSLSFNEFSFTVDAGFTNEKEKNGIDWANFEIKFKKPGDELHRKYALPPHYVSRKIQLKANEIPGHFFSKVQGKNRTFTGKYRVMLSEETDIKAHYQLVANW